jgi:hypothetical protein
MKFIMGNLQLRIISLWLIILLFNVKGNSQNKSGYTRIFWGGAMYAKFDGSTNRPVTGQLITSITCPLCPYIYTNASSNICDSATSNLLFMCNSMRLFDTLGNIIDNGDSLQPSKIYAANNPPASVNTQGSLILPKGSNGLYYVFTPTVTDSTYTKFITSTIKFPYDLLQYHLVDMKANNGAGKVIQKNIPLIENNEINRSGMMAVRHANGNDWWLLKQGFDTNKVYTFLVTKDTVLLDTIQYFAEPSFGLQCGVGQNCFSTDGSKYAVAMGGDGRNLFLADFDRCYGILSNPKSIKIPLDSTTHPYYQSQGILDSILLGVCFSPNDSFIYITRAYNIYQYEVKNTDSATAWYRVKHGEDTTLQQFAYYGQLYKGIDNRIYIGKYGGTGTQNSVIDYPDLKGSACGFCRKCLRYDTGIDYSISLSNMPDFNLGALPYSCPPLSLLNPPKEDLNALEVYPNPSSTIFYIKNKKGKKKELYNSVGEMILSTIKDEINVSRLSSGMYYIKCEGVSKKVVVE